MLCIAAPRECEAVASAFGGALPGGPGGVVELREAVSLLCVGVGPASAGVSSGAAFAARPPRAVVSLGIGGAFEGSGLSPGDTALSDCSVLAGEGRLEASEKPPYQQLVGLTGIGFPPFSGGADRAPPCPELRGHLRSLCDAEGAIATVSAASGSAALARATRDRTGAIVEAMEGAAVHLASERFSVPFAEVRVISNIVGGPETRPWKLEEALAALGPLAVRIADALT